MRLYYTDATDGNVRHYESALSHRLLRRNLQCTRIIKRSVTPVGNYKEARENLNSKMIHTLHELQSKEHVLRILPRLRHHVPDTEFKPPLGN